MSMQNCTLVLQISEELSIIKKVITEHQFELIARVHPVGASSSELCMLSK